MDALLPAFVAALTAEFGDKTQWLALALGLHFRRIAPVLFGIALAALANSALAALAGSYISPLLSFEAATLMFALALLFAGVGALWMQKAPGSVEGWRLGAFASSFLAFFTLELGDKTQFLTFAIAVRSGAFWLSLAGAAAGILAASSVAILIGREYASALPVRAMRLGVAALFLLLGSWAALAALRLI